MKRNLKISLFLTVFAAIFVAFALFSCATDALPTEGYCYTATPGEQTNVKWTIKTVDDVVTLYFDIDKNATDKVQSTA
ncbi:MAG: hypothetical protein IKK94_02310, partial [Clostridia bacterium]|nr:hypothetical protein [Clostridia bacterium]